MKFRNNQAVKVLHGYFRGSVGIVELAEEMGGGFQNRYWVKVDGIVNGEPVTKSELMDEDYLSADLNAGVGDGN